MRLLGVLGSGLLCAGLIGTAVHGESYPEARSVVSVGGTATEIIYALGEGDRLVARDTTSVYPPQVHDLPDVGYMRRLSAEGVLSVGPDLIIARDTSGPPEVLDQLRAASVPMVFIHDGFSPDAVTDAIATIGTALGVEDKSDALAEQVSADLAALQAKVEALPAKRRVMFVLSLDGGRMNVAGRDTGADGIINLAGGENVMASSYSGYKLVDAEAVIRAAPDVILMMEPRGDHTSRKDEVMSLPPVLITPAGQSDAFIQIPGAALGFGPRTASFGQQLFDLLYGAEG